MRTHVVHPHLTTTSSRRTPGLALAEAVSLTEALPDLEMVASTVVPVPKPRAGTLFGPGKVDELAEAFSTDHIELVIIDGLVSPVQQRNLERAWKVKILDRTGLILEIFGDRAQTREGVLQVDLAHLSYQKTRLVRSWTHLERQRGGLGFVGGPGETQIEADRRALDERIQQIRRALSKVVKTRSLHRAGRAKVPFPVVALVGYTNAGKSTLFNQITGAAALAEDMLFATLDPTMRGLTLSGGQRIILSDTVGFISDLPTQLVAAFRATLEEVLDADVIIHVRDIAHPETEAQAADVLTILSQLGIDDVRREGLIEVLNKTDLLDEAALDAVKRRSGRAQRKIAVSALTGNGIPDLLALIEQELEPPKIRAELTLGFAEGRARAWLFEQKVVHSEAQSDDGYRLQVEWTEKQRSHFRSLMNDMKQDTNLS
ncbi:MAG: GTPase HflX [Pseudomonadota bacterium]